MGTIADKLLRVHQTKQDIKKAIESKNVQVPYNAPFSDYEMYIRRIKESDGTFLLFKTVDSMNRSHGHPEDAWAVVYDVDSDYFGGLYRYDQGQWNLIGNSSDGQDIMDILNQVLGPIEQYEGFNCTQNELSSIFDKILYDLPANATFLTALNAFGHITDYDGQYATNIIGYNTATLTPTNIMLRNQAYIESEIRLSTVRNMTIEYEMQMIQEQPNGYAVWIGSNFRDGFGLAFEDWYDWETNKLYFRLIDIGTSERIPENIVEKLKSKKCLLTIVRDLDNKLIKLYVDGEFIVQVDKSFDNWYPMEELHNCPICINKEGDYGINAIDQDVYALRLFPRVLTEEEILNHYNDFKEV